MLSLDWLQRSKSAPATGSAVQDRVVLQTALIKALTQQRSSRTQSSSERMPLNPRVRGGSLSAVGCCEGSSGTRTETQA